MSRYWIILILSSFRSLNHYSLSLSHLSDQVMSYVATEFYIHCASYLNRMRGRYKRTKYTKYSNHYRTTQFLTIPKVKHFFVNFFYTAWRFAYLGRITSYFSTAEVFTAHCQSINVVSRTFTENQYTVTQFLLEIN